MARVLISARDAGEQFHVHPETLRRLYREGRIPAYRLGRYLRFDADEVLEALRSTPTRATSSAGVMPDFDALDAA